MADLLSAPEPLPIHTDTRTLLWVFDQLQVCHERRAKTHSFLSIVSIDPESTGV
jgi:hypothetical protein